MNSHFIKNIQIENFKCFQNLQVDGIERVNLIGGKNNVGKTAFLEAVELLVSSNDTYDLLNNLQKMLKRRQINNIKGASENMVLDFIKKEEETIKINTNNKICEMLLTKPQNIFDNTYDKENIISTTSLSFAINGNAQVIALNKLLKYWNSYRDETDNINFVGAAKKQERDIAILYGSLTNLDKEDFLNASLTKFDENITSLKLIPTEDDIILKLKLKTEATPVLLSSLGEGINRYISILCAIWASKDGFLFIDEVENGIHYTNYKKLWEIIFQASVDANCQVFATSHSKECIEAFNEVQLEQEGGAYFELYNNVKKNIIMASLRDNEQLKYSLTHKGKFRGE